MTELNLINEDKFIKIDNELWLDSKSLGEALGFTNPTEAIKKIYQRYEAELKNFSIRDKVSREGQQTYYVRLFSEEGMYIVSMHATTETASKFRIALAKFLKQKRLEALHEAKAAGYITAEKINARYRNLRLTNSEIKRLHILLDAGVSKKDIAKLLRISVDSIRRIEKDLAELGE